LRLQQQPGRKIRNIRPCGNGWARCIPCDSTMFCLTEATITSPPLPTANSSSSLPRWLLTAKYPGCCIACRDRRLCPNRLLPERPKGGQLDCNCGIAVHAALEGTLHEDNQNLSTAVRSDLARIALEDADIPAVVVGIGIGMKGGVLLVPEDRIEAALKVLKQLEELG